MIAAYYRSLMVYFFTPLVASGLMSDSEVDKFEASITRKKKLLPIDIESSVIRNVCDYFVTPASK